MTAGVATGGGCWTTCRRIRSGPASLTVRRRTSPGRTSSGGVGGPRASSGERTPGSSTRADTTAPGRSDGDASAVRSRTSSGVICIQVPSSAADDHTCMERGLYIAASGMLAEMARQDQLANDLANASTPGYKADRVSQKSFGDLLLGDTADGSTVGPPGQGSAIDKQVIDLRPQALRDTSQPLDLAVEGEGWFGVQTKQGIRYT